MWVLRGSVKLLAGLLPIYCHWPGYWRTGANGRIAKRLKNKAIRTASDTGGRGRTHCGSGSRGFKSRQSPFGFPFSFVQTGSRLSIPGFAMIIADLTDQVFARSDQLLWLWNFYVGIVVATLAAAVFVPVVRADRRARIGLMALFAFLAYANLESMRWVLKQWHSLVEANRSVIVPGPLDSVREAPHPLWVFPFHLILDAGVLAAVWCLTRARRHSEASSASITTSASSTGRTAVPPDRTP